MIERILFYLFFTTWIIGLIGTFALGVTINEHKYLEKYAAECWIVALTITLIIVSVWW